MTLFLLECNGGTGVRDGTEGAERSPSDFSIATFEVEPYGLTEEGGVAPP